MRRLLAASMRKLRAMIAGPCHGESVDAGNNPFVEIGEPLMMRDRTYTDCLTHAAEVITLDSAVEPLWLPDVGEVAAPEPWCYCI